jgi:hypothetical protein
MATDVLLATKPTKAKATAMIIGIHGGIKTVPELF